MYYEKQTEISLRASTVNPQIFVLKSFVHLMKKTFCTHLIFVQALTNDLRAG